MKAFPTIGFLNGSDFQPQEGGMDLRDYFAAHAPDVPSDFPYLAYKTVMKKEHVLPPGRIREYTVEVPDESESHRIVRWRFAYADAMIKARDK